MVRGLLTIAVILAGLGGLYAVTLSHQGPTCEVCVVFEGRRQCRTATAATRPEAQKHAMVTACALVTRGVTEDLACQRAAPESMVCK